MKYDLNLVGNQGGRHSWKRVARLRIGLRSLCSMDGGRQGKAMIQMNAISVPAGLCPCPLRTYCSCRILELLRAQYLGSWEARDGSYKLHSSVKPFTSAVSSCQSCIFQLFSGRPEAKTQKSMSA